MTKKTNLTQDDKETFITAMRGVKALKQTKIHHKTTPPKPKLIKQPLDIEDDESIPLSDFDKMEQVDSETLLEFARSGIQHKILRKLRNGQYNVEAKLDMHGMTVDQARMALSRFLSACRRDNIRHVLIIHGKGRGFSTPILKNKLNNWLRQTEQVLAFTSATVKDGCSGALYVLLRR